MLKRLHIRNYALIEDLKIDFSDNLTIITGETGAGKSILLGALQLVMGGRADNKVFYREGEKCIIEAFFDVKKYDTKDFFEDNDLDYAAETVVRRELTPSGKSRAFINDTPTNNNALKQLTGALVDLHQQFDTLDIHNVNFQLRMVDALANNTVHLNNYQNIYKKWAADKKRLTKLISQNEQSAKEMDFIRFQLDELRNSALQAGEQAELELVFNRQSNAESIIKATGEIHHMMNEGEAPIISMLQEAYRSLLGVKKFHEDIPDLAKRLDSLVIEMSELATDFERISEGLEHDPQAIAEAQERLNILYKLQKKHLVTSVEELLTIQSDLEAQLSGFDNLEEEIASLDVDIKKKEKKLRAVAATLTERRKSVVDGFEKKVDDMLTLLSMPHARLQVAVRPSEKLLPTGTDEVEFLFRTNPGAKYLPIKNVASGGELARLTLCTKSLVADAIPLPTMIFDEIDTGISGDVALKMGHILKELSDRHQVIAITHTPQVAARASSHYFVYKNVVDNKSATRVKLLTKEERIRSIATMLSGNPPSDSALVTAKELLADV